MSTEYETIKEIEFMKISKSIDPNVIFVTGQTGAGKTTLIQHLIQKGNYQDQYVIIDNDRWRPFVPNYKEIVKKNGTDEVKQITDYTKEWRNELFQESVDNHYNIIYHTSMTNIEEVISQINLLQKQGYSVSLAIMACSKVESAFSNCLRYVNDVLRKRIWKIFI